MVWNIQEQVRVRVSDCGYIKQVATRVRAMSSCFAGAQSSSSAALRQQISDLTKQLAAAKQPLRRQAKAEKRRPRPRGLTKHQEHLVSGIYVLSEYDARVAASKLVSLHPQGDSLSLEEAERLVEDIFVSLPDGFAADVCNPSDKAWKLVNKAAHAYLAGHKTVCWVERQNVMHGVAPTSTAVRDHFEDVLREARGQGAEVAVSNMTKPCARIWAARWCRRWGVRRGTLQKVEPLDATVIRAKVPCLWFRRWNLSVKFLIFGVQFSYPFSGPTFFYHM